MDRTDGGDPAINQLVSRYRESATKWDITAEELQLGVLQGRARTHRVQRADRREPGELQLQRHHGRYLY